MMAEFDVIVLGTGLKECVLSGLMCVSGKSVLHLDSNPYYGGEGASLSSLEELCQRFSVSSVVKPVGAGKEWNIDLIPKLLLANGPLVQMLLSTGVTRYLDFKAVGGNFVYKGGKIHRVPCSEAEMQSSDLMGMFDRRRFRRFMSFVLSFDEHDPRTHRNIDPKEASMRSVFRRFDLGDDVIEVIGRGLALYHNDQYLDEPCLQTLQQIRLYSDSLERFGPSPFLYPLFGLGELPQGFIRLGAAHGSRCELNRRVEEIVMEEGRAVGVRSQGELLRCKQLVCDPSYAPERVRTISRVIRVLCLLNHPVKHTHDAKSCQIIIPGAQLHRKSDVFVAVLSHSHGVSSEGMFLAAVSTLVETGDPEKEVQPGLSLLEPILQKFMSVSNLMVPMEDGRRSQIFISRSFDHTSHLRTETEDLLDLYHRITGSEFSFDTHPDD